MTTPTTTSTEGRAPSTTTRTIGIAGNDARERLLAGLPVRERGLQLAGISTAVLEGGARH